METYDPISILGIAFLKALEARSNLPKYSISEDPQTLVTFSYDGEADNSVVVADDRDELTIYYGDVTHTHVANYDDVGDAEKTQRTVLAALQQLEDFFSGRLEARVYWWGGSLRRRGPPSAKAFVWPDAYDKKVDEGSD